MSSRLGLVLLVGWLFTDSDQAGHRCCDELHLLAVIHVVIARGLFPIVVNAAIFGIGLGDARPGVELVQIVRADVVRVCPQALRLRHAAQCSKARACLVLSIPELYAVFDAAVAFVGALPCIYWHRLRIHFAQSVRMSKGFAVLTT